MNFNKINESYKRKQLELKYKHQWLQTCSKCFKTVIWCLSHGCSDLYLRVQWMWLYMTWSILAKPNNSLLFFFFYENYEKMNLWTSLFYIKVLWHVYLALLYLFQLYICYSKYHPSSYICFTFSPLTITIDSMVISS